MLVYAKSCVHVMQSVLHWSLHPFNRLQTKEGNSICAFHMLYTLRTIPQYVIDLKKYFYLKVVAYKFNQYLMMDTESDGRLEI